MKLVWFKMHFVMKNMVHNTNVGEIILKYCESFLIHKLGNSDTRRFMS